MANIFAPSSFGNVQRATSYDVSNEQLPISIENEFRWEMKSELFPQRPYYNRLNDMQGPSGFLKFPDNDKADHGATP